MTLASDPKSSRLPLRLPTWNSEDRVSGGLRVRESSARLKSPELKTERRPSKSPDYNYTECVVKVTRQEEQENRRKIKTVELGVGWETKVERG